MAPEATATAGSAAPAYTRLAGPISRAAWQTGYGRARWRKEQFRETQRQARARERAEGERTELAWEALKEQRVGREQSRALAYEQLAMQAQEREEDREWQEEMAVLDQENRVRLRELELAAAEGRLSDQQEHDFEMLKRQQAGIDAQRREEREWDRLKFFTSIDLTDRQTRTAYLDTVSRTLGAVDAKWGAYGRTFSTAVERARKNIRDGITEALKDGAVDVADPATRLWIDEQMRDYAAVQPDGYAPDLTEQNRRAVHTYDDGSKRVQVGPDKWQYVQPPKEPTPVEIEQDRADRDLNRAKFTASLAAKLVPPIQFNPLTGETVAPSIEAVRAAMEMAEQLVGPAPEAAAAPPMAEPGADRGGLPGAPGEVPPRPEPARNVIEPRPSAGVQPFGESELEAARRSYSIPIHNIMQAHPELPRHKVEALVAKALRGDPAAIEMLRRLDPEGVGLRMEHLPQGRLR